MHKKSDILLDWEINTIDYYFQTGLSYYSDLLQERFPENEESIIGEKEYAIGSFQYFRRSILYELNALIEHWLLYASTNEGDFFDNSNLKRSRASSDKIIKQKYNIELEKISGFKEVELIRETVNSLKHRGGFDFTDYSKGIPEFKTVNDDIERLKVLKDAAIRFIKELVAVIIIIEEGNTEPNKGSKVSGQKAAK